MLRPACPVRPRFRRPAARTYHGPMPGESLFNALEPLLERVNKPIQYVGGELNSTVKDWNVGGHGPDGEELTDALGADVPRRIRGGRAQPGRHDPLRGPQRASRRPRRAHVCRVARHGGAAARGGPAAVHGRRAPLGARLRPLRPQLLDRARLHQHAHGARPRRHPAARGGPRRRRPDRHRRRSRGLQPRADRRRSSTPPSSATASRPCSRSPTSWGSGRPRAVPAVAARCCCAWLAPAASTSRRSTTSPTCPTGASSASRRRPDARACRGACPSTPSWTSTRGPTRSSRSCRSPSRCTSACRSRSSAAARAAAASARPA